MLGVFWITSDCNLNCIYCYEGNDKKHKVMSKEVIEKAIDLIIKNMEQTYDKELKIEVHGGEPFLEFDIMKYLVETVKEKVKNKNIEISFGCTTNATLLNEERINFIVKELNNFTVSLDGKCNTQNYSRPFKNGAGTHDIVEKNVKDLLKLLPYLRVRLTFNHITVSNLFDNVKYLIDLGIKYIVPVRDFYDNEFSNEDFSVLKEQLIQIKEYSSKHDDAKIGLLDTSQVKKLGKCSGGITSFNIDPSGDISPCTLTVGNDEFIIGNVHDGININKRNELLSYSDIKNKECIGCDLYSYCSQTRCKMINKIIVGDFSSPSPAACMEKNVLYDINFRN